MGRGLEKIVKMLGGMVVRSGNDTVKYGPHTEDGRTTDGLRPGDMVRIVCGRPVDAKVIRVVDGQIALVARIFSTSGKASRPYKAHVSAIERK